jgi:hypothetical protein
MSESTQAPNREESASGKLKAVVVVLLLLDMVLIALERYASGAFMIPEFIGALLAPIIFAILIVLIARVFKRARSPRAAAKIAIGTLAVIGVGSCGGLLTAMTATSGGAESASAAQLATLSATAAEKSVPKQVDSVTWLRGVTAVGDTLAYQYQLTNMTASEVDPSSVDAFRGQLIERACGNATVRSGLLAKGVVIRYHYADLADSTLTSIDVTQAACSPAQAQ